MRRCPALLLLLVAATAAAQAPPDTTAPWRYFPLEVGNRWDYFWDEGTATPSPRGYWRWVVRDDTTLGGHRYFALEQAVFSLSGAPTSSTTRYVRFDTTTARVVERRNGADTGFFYAPCPLDLPFEGSECQTAGYWTAQTGIGYAQDTGLGVTTSVKRFEPLLTGRAVRLAAGIGFVRYETIVEKGGTIDVRIAYAHVGGVTYGWPLVVAAEPAPPAAALTLTAAPSPAAGRVRVALTLAVAGPVKVAVFDALGREVAVLLDGSRGAGAHAVAFDGSALPSGAYLVRATSGGATATARLTLAR